MVGGGEQKSGFNNTLLGMKGCYYSSEVMDMTTLVIPIQLAGPLVLYPCYGTMLLDFPREPSNAFKGN